MLLRDKPTHQYLYSESQQFLLILILSFFKDIGNRLFVWGSNDLYGRLFFVFLFVGLFVCFFLPVHPVLSS